MSKKPDFYTFGYAGQSVEVLQSRLDELGARVVDIRLSPCSRQPGWSKAELSEHLGERYRHVPALGNVNYKSGEPIQIANLELGLKILTAPIAAIPSVLLCGCRHYAGCHRAVVADALNAEGYAVQELNLAPDAAESLTPSDVDALNADFTRLSHYLIRLRCENPPKGTREAACDYLRRKIEALCSQCIAAGGDLHGWTDPADPLGEFQLSHLWEELAEVKQGAYPVPLPDGCVLLPEANFDPFTAGRLYSGKVIAWEGV